MYRYGRSAFRTMEEGSEKEWLLVNGIGGFANGSITGNTTRIHGGYLIASFTPPVDRFVMVSKLQERLLMEGQEIDFACQMYLGENKNGCQYMECFKYDVLPEFHYRVGDFFMKKTIAMEYGHNTTTVCYEIENGSDSVEFFVTPLFACRGLSDVAEISQQNPDTKITGQTLCVTAPTLKEHPVYFYASEGSYFDRKQIPTSMATPNYLVEENQLYYIDNRTGFGGVDNHATPYDVKITLQPYEKKAVYFVCSTEAIDFSQYKSGFTIAKEYKERVYDLMNQCQNQDVISRKFCWASDQFIVSRQSTGLKTILAGLPWFTDWGRDTMIAMTGLTLCTGRYEDCKEILESFSKYIKNGLIPNVFPNSAKEEPMYNTLDASLWYFYAVERFLHYAGTEENFAFIKTVIYPVLEEIIEYYKKGTDFSIGMDEDGLIHGGDDFDQITWMDVRVGDWVVTPRHGKPVEINALWYNALKVMEWLSKIYQKPAQAYGELADKVKEAFCHKFWNEEKGCLYDVVDPIEDCIRPNQIWAVSLPYTMLSPEQEKKVVAVVTKYLYTPYGLRSLTPTDAGYKGQYIGKLINRDGAYHMGTTWGYILGGYISAYCKVNNHSKEAVNRAFEMVELVTDHMKDGCINGIAEIFDGDFACTSRGCYTQAWSVGEVFRAYTEDVLPFLQGDEIN